MDKSIEEKLYDSIIVEDLESISNLLSQGNLNFFCCNKNLITFFFK